jgi:hypothetical protein
LKWPLEREQTKGLEYPLFQGLAYIDTVQLRRVLKQRLLNSCFNIRYNLFTCCCC